MSKKPNKPKDLDYMLGMPPNVAIFEYARLLGFTHCQLAQALGVSEFTVMSWARHPDSAAYRTAPRRHVLLIGLLYATKDHKTSAKFPHGEL